MIITSIVITLMLMAMLRSVVLPLVAVAFDLLTTAATFGILTLLFNGEDPLLGGPGYLDPMSIIGIFSAVFGVAMVYEVELLQRTREAFVGGADAESAIKTGLAETAATGTGAAIAMVAAILPFAFTDLITIRQIGLGLAIAIVLDALIVRPVLLPAAVEVLGRRAWWPTGRKARAPKEAPPTTPPLRPTPAGGGLA